MNKPDNKQKIGHGFVGNKANLAGASDAIPIVSAEKKQKKKTLHDIVPSAEDNSAGPLKKFDIPKFDLAEQILSEHRKNTAARRRKTIPKSEPQTVKTEPLPTKPANEIIERRKIQPSEHDSVIAQIVARDITNFYKSDPG